MTKKRTYLSLASVLALAGVTFWSCSSSTDDRATTDYSYQGLGSKWTAAFTDGTNFEITYDAEADGTVEMTINGTYVEYSNKFRKLTVTSASGTNAPTAGTEAYGLEIPGFAFFLKPIGADSEPIVMVAAGSCPTADFNANWIIAKFQEPDQTPKADTDALGTAEFVVTGTSKTATINQHRFDTGASLGAGSPITLNSCTGGVQAFDDGGDGGTMYMTANGGALVNPGTGIIFAAPQGSADATSSDWDGTYSGLVFSESNAEKIFPAKVTISGTTGSGVMITDVENDTLDTDELTFASLAAISGTKGLFRGTVTAGAGGAQPLNCVTSTVNSRKILACNGADSAANGSGVYGTFFFLGTAR